jgi:hypothetical protein
MLVHRVSQFGHNSNSNNAGLVANNLRGPRDAAAASGAGARRSSRQSGNEPSIIQLWERVETIRERPSHTALHIQPLLPSISTQPRLSSEGVSRVLQPLKVRFQKGIRRDWALLIGSKNEEELVKFSQRRLDSLLAKIPKFATRKRVYSKDEPRKEPEKDATFSIWYVSVKGLTKPTYNLLTLDIVDLNGERVLVCVDEQADCGAVHHCELISLESE